MRLLLRFHQEIDMAQSLNMNEWVTPNHWTVAQFEHFSNMDPKDEFALIAPVLIYFEADARWTQKARSALKKLKTAQHPLIDQPIAAILKMSTTPDGLINRYNALVMALADEVHPGIQSRIEAYGAFAFVIGDDKNVLCGDASGLFAFFDSFSHLQERIHEAVDAMEEMEEFFE